MKDTMPDAFDRREANRDAAGWVRKALEEINGQLSSIRMESVVCTQQIEGKISLIDEKVDNLYKALLSAFDGPPEAHRQYHIDEAKRLKQEAEDAEDERKQARADRHRMRRAAIVIGASLMILGLIAMAQNFVLGVNAGKTVMELQKNEPVKQRGHSEGAERFNR